MTEHQKKYVGKSEVFDLELLPDNSLREEAERFIWERMKEVTMTTLLNDRGNYNLLCRFLGQKGKGLEHFLDWDRDTWLRKMKAWMLEEGMPLNYERQGTYGSTYRMQPGLLGYVERLLDFLEPEDTREECQKDIWELEKLGIPIRKNLVKNYKTINFTKISQEGIREETKKGIYLNLQNEAVTCVARELTAMHLDDWTIARLLGHSSLKNVKYYRKMSNQTLADETRAARHRISQKILECLDGWEEEYEQIRQDDCFK